MSRSRISIINKAIWLLKSRPQKFLATVRCYLLFQRSRVLSRCFPRLLDGISLGNNVRIQRLGSLSCERPKAQLEIGDHCIIYEHARIEAYGAGRVEIKECSILGDIRVYSRKKIQIGRRFLSSWNVFIQDYDPHPVQSQERAIQVQQMVESFRPGLAIDLSRQSRPVPLAEGEAIIIGDDVWVGANAIILKGAEIGDGCIVAAGAVVLRGEYAKNSLIAGNPARVVKNLEQHSVATDSVYSRVGG